ncbi:Tryptophan-rich protein TspO [bioreactor metagenome]|uniref:Tryptophan-rich protein TspO n=1 Tax=bioreactor metagenome TaxID=1076179 RepID=A0A644X1C2_9ZZZZ
MTRRNILKLVISLIIPLAIGFIAGQFTSDAIPGWYASLNKPSFNPPDWIFGPVWTVLYVLMGISLFMIWSRPRSQQRTLAVMAFLLQMTLNFAWTFLFFYYQQMGFALADILLLLASIIFMMIRFHRVSKLSAWLNFPYLLWVSFATALNVAYLVLN